jgi:hypothetical protein
MTERLKTLFTPETLKTLEQRRAQTANGRKFLN